jgi:hypothetical protein
LGAATGPENQSQEIDGHFYDFAITLIASRDDKGAADRNFRASLVCDHHRNLLTSALDSETP